MEQVRVKVPCSYEVNAIGKFALLRVNPRSRERAVGAKAGAVESMLGGWVNPHREQQTIPQGQTSSPPKSRVNPGRAVGAETEGVKHSCAPTMASAASVSDMYMCVYMCVYICMYMYVCTAASVSDIYMRVYLCVYVRMHMYVFIHISG